MTNLNLSGDELQLSSGGLHLFPSGVKAVASFGIIVVISVFVACRLFLFWWERDGGGCSALRALHRKCCVLRLGF